MASATSRSVTSWRTYRISFTSTSPSVARCFSQVGDDLALELGHPGEVLFPDALLHLAAGAASSSRAWPPCTPSTARFSFCHASSRRARVFALLERRPKNRRGVRRPSLVVLLEGPDLDLRLHHSVIELLDLLRAGSRLHPQARGRLIDDVDRLVGQEAIGHVPVRQLDRRVNGSVRRTP